MIVSWRWISEFVDLTGVTQQQLAEKLTRASCEVEAIELKNRALDFVLIAKIIAIKPHPNAQKLQLVTISTGEQRCELVCGAQNFVLDDIVAYAPLGTTFDDGLVLGAKEIAGVVSAGMLCSAKELGVSEDHQGLWIINDELAALGLAAEAVLGKNLAHTLGLYSDTLLHIDNKSITNRNDLWGVLGMAREIAAVFERPFMNPYDKAWQEQQLEVLQQLSQGEFEVSIQTPLVHSYALLEMHGVSGKGQSPLWLRYRLYLLGLRSINALVDSSNYVMLELGIPNHIYDYQQLAGQRLRVFELQQAETFITLDGVQRELEPLDVVIGDAKQLQIIAGIMGGAKSMVSDATQQVMIEAAVWEASAVRKSSLRLALRTDSSARYEKSLDSTAIELTLLRLASLIKQLQPSAVVSAPILWAKKSEWQAKSVHFSTQWVTERLGVALTYQEISRLLERLGFMVRGDEQQVVVSAPSFRSTKGDLITEDVLEEIARVYGFDNLTAQAPLSPVLPHKLSHAVQLERAIQDFMVLHGQAFEVYTHPLVGEAMLKMAQWSNLNEQLKMLNSTNVERDRMRPSLVPSMLEAMALNSKHFDSFRLFEFGRVQLADEQHFSQERYQLAVLFYDHKASCFMALLDRIEALMRYLGRAATFHFEGEDPHLESSWLGLHPYEHARVKVDGKLLGSLNTIHPLLMQKYKVKGNASLLILELTPWLNDELKKKFSYQSLLRYPTSRFDSTWIVGPEQSAGELMHCVQTSVIDVLLDSYIFDVYAPEHVNERHITIRVIFGSDKSTLDAQQVKHAEQQLMEHLSLQGYQLKQ